MKLPRKEVLAYIKCPLPMSEFWGNRWRWVWSDEAQTTQTMYSRYKGDLAAKVSYMNYCNVVYRGLRHLSFWLSSSAARLRQCNDDSRYERTQPGNVRRAGGMTCEKRHLYFYTKTQKRQISTSDNMRSADTWEIVQTTFINNKASKGVCESLQQDRFKNRDCVNRVERVRRGVNSLTFCLEQSAPTSAQLIQSLQNDAATHRDKAIRCHVQPGPGS